MRTHSFPHSHVLKFLSVGALTNLIDYAVFSVLLIVGAVPPVGAHIAAYCIAASFSFAAHRGWTFAATQHDIKTQALRFVLVNLLGLLFSSLIVKFCSPYFNPWGAKIIATLLLVLWFYAAARLVIFRK